MSNAIWRKSSVVCRNDFLLTAEGLVQQDKSSAPCVWTVSFERTLFPRESRKHILLVLGWINVCHELGLPCCHKLLGLCSVLWSGGTDAVEHLFLIHAIAMFGWKSTSWAACLSLENGQWRNSREKQRWSLQSNFQQFTEQVMTFFFFLLWCMQSRFEVFVGSQIVGHVGHSPYRILEQLELSEMGSAAALVFSIGWSLPFIPNRFYKHS